MRAGPCAIVARATLRAMPLYVRLRNDYYPLLSGGLEVGGEGLALDERLTAKDEVPRCGLYVVDIDEHTIDELYDVAVLPGVRQAEAWASSEDLQREISIEG